MLKEQNVYIKLLEKVNIVPYLMLGSFSCSSNPEQTQTNLLFLTKLLSDLISSSRRWPTCQL